MTGFLHCTPPEKAKPKAVWAEKKPVRDPGGSCCVGGKSLGKISFGWRSGVSHSPSGAGCNLHLAKYWQECWGGASQFSKQDTAQPASLLNQPLALWRPSLSCPAPSTSLPTSAFSPACHQNSYTSSPMSVWTLAWPLHDIQAMEILEALTIKQGLLKQSREPSHFKSTLP